LSVQADHDDHPHSTAFCGLCRKPQVVFLLTRSAASAKLKRRPNKIFAVRVKNVPPKSQTEVLTFDVDYCSGGSPLVRFLARSISVTAIRISARVLRSGASSIACFSGGP
jgi:hypothetical protein